MRRYRQCFPGGCRFDQKMRRTVLADVTCNLELQNHDRESTFERKPCSTNPHLPAPRFLGQALRPED